MPGLTLNYLNGMRLVGVCRACPPLRVTRLPQEFYIFRDRDAFDMISASSHRLAKPLIWSLVTLAAGVVGLSAARLSLAAIDVPFLLLALITINLGTRIAVKIPHVKGQVNLSAAFVFLALLLFDGEAAVLLAVLAALCATLHFSRKALQLLFNSALAAVTTCLLVVTLRLCFGQLVALPRAHTYVFLLIICLTAALQAFFHSSVLALNARDDDAQRPFWRMWSRAYGWTFLTYFTFASAAGMLAKLIGIVGFYPAIAATAVVAMAHYAYCSYLKDARTSVAQVRQFEQRVATLQESEELFRSACDYAAIGMALVSTKGRWLQVNRSLCDILGYTEEELLATTSQKVTHPDDLGAALANITQLLKRRMPTYQMVTCYLHKQGHMVCVLWCVSRVRDLHTDTVQLICLLQDSTARTRAEARVGGDELTILLEDLLDETEAVTVAERVEKELSVPFMLSGREVFTTVSIGIAPSSIGYENPEDILRDADTAMYRAKSLGKAR